MEGREPVYRVGGEVYRTGQSEPAADAGKDGYRLPSSEEWEYAARGGLVGKRFPWNVYVDDRPGVINHNRANFYNMRTFDYEDRYEEQGYHPDYASGGYPYTSPVASFRPNDYGLYDMAGNVREWTASASGTSMILRGGTWGSNGSICRIGATQTAAPGTTNYSTGFRTVRRP
jgi:formylglycine-generating enzyme required for sulfatase activity